MPLRDHFHPPLDDLTTWEVLHGGWPMVIAQHLNAHLPARYVAGPRVHAGAQIEIDVAAYERDTPAFPAPGGNGTAWSPTRPSLAVETDLLDSDEYEVRVYDTKRNRRLVAAIEVVSPANKDRAEHRQTFVGKCEALLRKGVSVVVVDLVTSRRFNLYTDLLRLVGQSDPSMAVDPPWAYAAACRWVELRGKRTLETWSHPLIVGQTLPTLPLWLAEDFAVPLDLEATYEETCRALRIP
ncbi:MAG: DUF4058 family protein [Gemmataceae bacterium]